MNVYLFVMQKKLTDIDSIYYETLSKLDKKARILYCESLVDKAQSNLINNNKHINKKVSEQLDIIIFVAQNELKTLLKT